MTTITQLPAPLNYNTVAGNPATLVFNVTLTDSSGNPVPWSDVTGYQVDITDQYGNVVQGVQPTITSPMDNQLQVSWTAAQTLIISEALQPRMALSIFISDAGPYALVSGLITMTPPEYPSGS